MKFDQDVAHDEVLHLAGDELPRKLPTDLSVVTLVVSQFDCGTKQVASGDYFREIVLFLVYFLCWKNPKSMIFCSRVPEQLWSRLVIFSDFGLGQPKRHFLDTFCQFWP